jgi:Outer membrane protein beta-barrel domain
MSRLRTLPAFLFLITSTLTAQEQSWRGLGLLAGPAEYDLSGTGWSWTAAARFDLPVGRVLVVEPGVGFFTYQTQPVEPVVAGAQARQASLLAVPRAVSAETTNRNSFLLPEVSVQLQYPGTRIRPYLGVGAGGALAVGGARGTDVTVHGALGVRAALGRSWTVRGEGRARNISGFEANNSIVEFLVGVNRQL